METSANISVSPTRVAMNTGALTAILMLVVFAFGWQVVGWLVFVCGVYLGMKAFRNELGGIIVYSKALNAGFQTAFFASLILAFSAYVTTTMKPILIKEMLETMEQQLTLSSAPAELVEPAMLYWRETLSPVVFGGINILMYTVIGTLLGIVLAFFVRNAKPGEFVEY
jgi:hypothetical protein